jgi:hypothetical protein
MFIDFDETSGDVLDRLVELDRVLSRMYAVQAELLVEAASLEARVDEYALFEADSDEQRLVLIEDAVRDELGCALRRSPVVMQAMIDTARWLCGTLTATLGALHAGDITLAHARIIVDAAEQLPAEKIAVFEAPVLATARRSNLSLTRKAANRVARALDPDGWTVRRKEAKCTRDVWTYDDADGLAILTARLTREQASTVLTTVNAAARDAKAGGDHPEFTIGEHRAAALVALVTGAQGAPAVRAHVDLVIDLPTFLGLQTPDGPGSVSPDVRRDLLADPAVAVTIRRLVTDPLTGHLLDYGRKTYEIPERLREFIIARDRTCRFPGCGRRADLAQIDHAIPWDDGGTTSPANLGALCVRHHQLKTFAGWQITESKANGSCVWISPQGRRYDHDPPPY